MTSIELDPRVVSWLREDRPGVGATTLAVVTDHARRHPRRRGGSWWARLAGRAARPWPSVSRLRPGLAIAGLALVCVVGGTLYLGLQPRSVGPAPSPTTSVLPSPLPTTAPSASGPLSMLAGTWFGTDGTHTILITVRDCAREQSCGTFERIDANGEHCVYELAYRSADAETLAVTTGGGRSIGCAYSPWPNEVIELRHVPYDILRLRVAGEGVANVDANLTRAALRELPRSTSRPSGYPTPSANSTRLPHDFVGTWMSTQLSVYPLLVTLHDCAAGGTCGVLERIDDNGEHCVYALTLESSAVGEIDMTTDWGNSFGCGYSGWSGGRVGLRSGADSLDLQLPEMQGGPTISLVRADL